MKEMRDIGADATVVARRCTEASVQISACQSPPSQAELFDARSVL